MIFNVRFTTFLFLALGLLALFGSSQLFSGCNDGRAPTTATAVPRPAIQAQQTAQREAEYQAQLDSLAERNTGLQDQLQSTKAALAKSKQKAKGLEATVQAFLDVPMLLTEADTAQALADCDTLRTEVGSLLTAASEKDSLYDETVEGLEQQVANRDTAISLHQDQYRDLRLAFDQSLGYQQTLMDENTFYRKQARRQKVKSRVLSAALMVVSGFATYSLIQHSQ